jgi:uncharacterized SAM-binding protein YcdF (DUF218 family)
MPVDRLLQLVGALTLAAVLLTAFTPMVNVVGAGLAGATVTMDADIPAADAIVVLGAGIVPEGELTESSLKRTVRGIEILNRGLAPRIVFLGPHDIDGYGSEAEVRSRLARTLGVRPEAIILDEDGKDTRGEAIATRERLRGRGVRSIILVTETQHLIRAKPLFESAGFEVFPAPADHYSIRPDSPAGRMQMMKRILEEQAARIYYHLAGYL